MSLRPQYAPMFEALPVELIAEILGELDLSALITVSCLSRRLREISSDSALNPWRKPILRNLRDRNGEYEDCFRTLSVRSSVPRNNWGDILSVAKVDFLLFKATLPNLPERDWEECFKRRFLPGWAKWKKDCRWKEAFIKLLFRVSHRSLTSCTVDETWTKYVVLNRNGSANLLESSSRTFNPQHLFNEMKIQSNLAHLETHIRLVVEFADVRILALGVLNKPRSSFLINENARVLLHPPGIHRETDDDAASVNTLNTRTSLDGRTSMISFDSTRFALPQTKFEHTLLTHPLPSSSHANYPFFTPGGGDKRWIRSGLLEEQGNHWVGGLLLTAQLVTNETRIHSGELPELQDLDLVVGPGRNHYASFTFSDLDTIAPWMAERVSKRIDGQGLGF